MIQQIDQNLTKKIKIDQTYLAVWKRSATFAEKSYGEEKY